MLETMAGPRDAKRKSILTGASNVFRQEGYDGASMDRIAEAAGVSKRTVYNHFGSKETLFEAVIGELAQMAIELKRVVWNPERPLEDQLRDFARGKVLMAQVSEVLDLARVGLGVAIQQPEFAQDIIQQLRDGESYLVDWLRAAHDAGRLEVEDPEYASELFWNMLGGALFWAPVVDGPKTNQEAVRVANDLVAAFLCRFAVS